MSKNHYEVCVRRLGTLGSQARSGRLSVQVDTTLSDAGHAFDAIEMLLTSIGGSLIASLEAAAPILKFEMNAAQAIVRADLSDSAPVGIDSIEYVIAIDTDEIEARLEMAFVSAVESAVVLAAIDPRIIVRGRVERMPSGH